MADTEILPTPVTFKKRGAKSNARKRVATPPPESDSDSGFESSEDEQGHRMKRRKRVGVVTASSSLTNGSRPDEPVPTTEATAVASNADNATKQSTWYDENPGLTARPNVPAAFKTTSESDGTYRGASGYGSFIRKDPDRLSAKTVGPQKTSTNVRTITTTDFAPDVCKDYKQTGFCGFGDSCKFLHAREDYAQGWQLDREWDINTKSGKQKTSGKVVGSANRDTKLEYDEEDESLLEKIPFACVICKGPYKSPIVTKCGHFFCESCALKRYRKDPSCAACGSGTGGVFNVAKKLNRLLERKRERIKTKREQAIENGEEPLPLEDGE